MLKLPQAWRSRAMFLSQLNPVCKYSLLAPQKILISSAVLCSAENKSHQRFLRWICTFSDLKIPAALQGFPPVPSAKEDEWSVSQHAIIQFHRGIRGVTFLIQVRQDTKWIRMSLRKAFRKEFGTWKHREMKSGVDTVIIKRTQFDAFRTRRGWGTAGNTMSLLFICMHLWAFGCETEAVSLLVGGWDGEG